MTTETTVTETIALPEESNMFLKVLDAALNSSVVEGTGDVIVYLIDSFLGSGLLFQTSSTGVTIIMALLIVLKSNRYVFWLYNGVIKDLSSTVVQKSSEQYLFERLAKDSNFTFTWVSPMFTIRNPGRFGAILNMSGPKYYKDDKEYTIEHLAMVFSDTDPDHIKLMTSAACAAWIISALPYKLDEDASTQDYVYRSHLFLNNITLSDTASAVEGKINSSLCRYIREIPGETLYAHLGQFKRILVTLDNLISSMNPLRLLNP